MLSGLAKWLIWHSSGKSVYGELHKRCHFTSGIVVILFMYKRMLKNCYPDQEALPDLEKLVNLNFTVLPHTLTDIFYCNSNHWVPKIYQIGKIEFTEDVEFFEFFFFLSTILNNLLHFGQRFFLESLYKLSYVSWREHWHHQMIFSCPRDVMKDLT